MLIFCERFISCVCFCAGIASASSESLTKSSSVALVAATLMWHASPTFAQGRKTFASIHVFCVSDMFVVDVFNLVQVTLFAAFDLQPKQTHAFTADKDETTCLLEM